jgi:DNA-binding response OmpR family regulator
MLSEVVGKADISFDVCHDGDSALRIMDENPPLVAIVDVALPGLYAYEVVEKVRSRPGLSEVKIILLSSVYNKMAYKRSPSSLYGADDYIEKHHVPNDLVPAIHRLLTDAHQPLSDEEMSPNEEVVEAATQSRDEEIESNAFTDEMNSKIQQAEENETSAASSNESVEKAHRLARNIVADIALYNQKKVDSGVLAGTFFEVLAEEIAEGRRLFDARFTVESLQDKDVLQLELDAFIENRRAEIS